MTDSAEDIMVTVGVLRGSRRPNANSSYYHVGSRCIFV